MLPFNVTSGLERQPSAKRDFLYAKTASFTPSLRQTGATFTNLGASGSVTATLPTNAAGEKGLKFTFAVVAAQPIVIDPGSAGAFYVEGAKLADDTSIVLRAVGDSVTVTSDGNGDWIVSGYKVWTVALQGETVELATDRVFYLANRACRVIRASQIHAVAAGGTSALQVTKDTGTNAPGAGTNLLATAFDLNATANTTQAGDLATTADLMTLASGDRLSVDFADAIQSTAGLHVSVDVINLTWA